jgi:hypothetical protein
MGLAPIRHWARNARYAPRRNPRTRPPILDVLVFVEELKRKCAAMIASEDSSPPDLESVLRGALRDNPSLTQKAGEKIARECGAVEERDTIRDLLEQLTGLRKPGPKAGEKSRRAISVIRRDCTFRQQNCLH